MKTMKIYEHGLTRPKRKPRFRAVRSAMAIVAAFGVGLYLGSATPWSQAETIANDTAIIHVVDTDETDVLRAIASPAAAGAFTPLQIHGDVTDADLEGLRVLFPGKALHLAAALPEDPVALAEAARRLEGLLERGLAERIVVDGTSDGLAGGLTPENARTAAAAGAAGLDAALAARGFGAAEAF